MVGVLLRYVTLTDVTKTIANVLQDLNRRHKDNRRCFARS